MDEKCYSLINFDWGENGTSGGIILFDLFYVVRS